MQKTAGWEKKEKKGQRCAGLPPFFIGEIWRAWGEGRRSGDLTAGAGLSTMGNHAPGSAGPRREGGRGDGQGALPKSESRERRLST